MGTVICIASLLITNLHVAVHNMNVCLIQRYRIILRDCKHMIDSLDVCILLCVQQFSRCKRYTSPTHFRSRAKNKQTPTSNGMQEKGGPRTQTKRSRAIAVASYLC